MFERMASLYMPQAQQSPDGQKTPPEPIKSVQTSEPTVSEQSKLGSGFRWPGGVLAYGETLGVQGQEGLGGCNGRSPRWVERNGRAEPKAT